MTIKQALKEVDVIQKVISNQTKVSLSFNNVGSDEELRLYSEENGVHLHSPSIESPYYFMVLFIGKNIDVILRGVSKEVKISY